MGKKILIILSLIILMAVGVNAFTVLIHNPISSATKGADFNMQVNISADTTNITSCVFYAQSVAKSANTSVMTLGTNNTGFDNATNSTMFLDISVLEDASDYIFNITCTEKFDGTQNRTNTTSATAVVIDSTVPTAPTDTDFRDDTPESITVDVTVTGTQTTDCYLWIGNQNKTMTHSGNTCTVTFTDQKYRTDYIWDYVVQAGDGLNNTYSTTYHLTTDQQGGGKLSSRVSKEEVSLTGLKTGLSNIIVKKVWVLPVWLWLVIGIGAFLLFRRK